MQRSRHRVAVVDDEASVRKALRRLFTSAELDCSVFASGRAFLDAVQEQTPDCAVIDLHMPGLTGLDVQRELRSAGVSVPTIIITAHDEPDTRARCLAAGAIAYLRKPFDDKALLDLVSSTFHASTN
ncbi:MAG TPA: response regulator [Burkholderiales bacterium]|nr:response regulator [Burkholderiales bacterium]